jgi:nitrite reductase/ring-hydroxylating ferredoxin subunit
VVLCALDELADPAARSFDFYSFKAFVVRRGDDVRGYLDLCPHAGWPLAMNDARRLTRDGAFLLCTGHGALFRPDDGMCVAGPAKGARWSPGPWRFATGAVVTA